MPNCVFFLGICFTNGSKGGLRLAQLISILGARMDIIYSKRNGRDDNINTITYLVVVVAVRIEQLTVVARLRPAPAGIALKEIAGRQDQGWTTVNPSSPCQIRIRLLSEIEHPKPSVLQI